MHQWFPGEFNQYEAQSSPCTVHCPGWLVAHQVCVLGMLTLWGWWHRRGEGGRALSRQLLKDGGLHKVPIQYNTWLLQAANDINIQVWSGLYSLTSCHTNMPAVSQDSVAVTGLQVQGVCNKPTYITSLESDSHWSANSTLHQLTSELRLYYCFMMLLLICSRILKVELQRGVTE